ncbi:MAG: sulfur carrier protein ThiS [Proteobacteria bacterium]|nr:sulfur carrier protein ThiS [Pseudomonadota bacterium]
MIDVSINGEKQSVSNGLNLTGLLQELGVSESVLVVEQNGEMIRKDRFDENQVSDGDVLELIRLTGGG